MDAFLKNKRKAEALFQKLAKKHPDATCLICNPIYGSREKNDLCKRHAGALILYNKMVKAEDVFEREKDIMKAIQEVSDVAINVYFIENYPQWLLDIGR